MSNTHYHITGNPGHVQSRHEIDDFAKDAPVLNLYLLALAKIQNMDQDQLTSFFSISGIHGLPYEPWDGVTGTQSGYCVHRSVLFPTWHRVYIALIEQVLQNEARALADQYTDATAKAQFKAAAERFRFPYWDWASKPRLPELLTKDTVEVFPPPLAQSTQISNPLQTYNFNPLSDTFPGRFGIWPRTLRSPGTGANPTTNDDSRPSAVDSTLRTHANELRGNVYNLLMYVHTWNEMSNAFGGSNSLEGVHDSMHVYIGGDAHMAVVPIAGFDPIFYLHHTNVDRLFGLWQALNPGSKVTPGDSAGGTSTIPPNTRVDENTALTPFHVSDSTFWTSSKLYDVKTFGYTYPELVTTPTDPNSVRTHVYNAVRQLYGGRIRNIFSAAASGIFPQLQLASFSGAAALAAPAAAALADPAPHAAHVAAAAPSVADPAPSGPAEDHTAFKEWQVVTSVKPSEWPTSGYIHIFLSHDPPTGAAPEWLNHDTLVGSVGVFVNKAPQCDNCNQFDDAGGVIHGQVILTDDLIQKGRNIHDVEATEKYLTDHIHWRCALINGEELPREKVPSLEVKVESATVHEPQGQTRSGGLSFPTREPFKVHHGITHGKVGGFSVPA